MRALWLCDGSLSLREDLDVGLPPENEARVRVLRAGICGTDLALVDALYPFEGVPGHEFVGVVEEGPDTLLGRRVVGEINAACGHCRECLGGMMKHCRSRTALGIRGRNGAFAEFLHLPVTNLHPVPDSISNDAATFAEPLAAALDIVERLGPLPREPVLVVGPGRLGQLVCRVLHASGARVIAVGRNARTMARLEGTVENTLLAEQVEPRSFAMAVECTGNPSGLAIALAALRPQGMLVLKSTYGQALELDLGRLVVDELRLVGSRCGPMDAALRWLHERRVDVEPLIDARLPLSAGIEAFALSRQPGVLKVVLDVGVG